MPDPGSYALREAFSTGLRESEFVPKNTQPLRTCYNAKPTVDGIVPPTFPTIVSYSIAGSTPQPGALTLFMYGGLTYALSATTLYSVDLATSTFTPLTSSLQFTDEGGSRIDVGGRIASLTPWTQVRTWSYVAGSGAVHATEGAGLDASLTQLMPVVIGRSYTITVKLTTPETVTWTLTIVAGLDLDPHTVAVSSDQQTFTYVFTAVDTSPSIGISIPYVRAASVQYITVTETTPAIVPGRAWQIAYLGSMVIAYNGNTVLMRRANDSVYWYIDNQVTPQTGDAYGSSLIQGNFPSTRAYWKDTWLDIWYSSLGQDATANRCLASDLQWSTPAGGDALYLYFASTANIQLYAETLQQAQSGDDTFPNIGSIRLIKAFAPGLVVYGENAIFAATPSTTGFDFRLLLNVGLADRGLVCATESEQVFVDASGVMWRIGSDWTVKELGYQEFLAPLIATPTSSVDTTAAHWSGAGSDWTIVADLFSKVTTNAAVLTQTAANQTLSLLSNTAYEVSYTYTRSSGTGSVYISLGTTKGSLAVAALGTKSEFLTASAGSVDITIAPTSDWVGTISELTIRRVPQLQLSYDPKYRDFYLVARRPDTDALAAYIRTQTGFAEVGKFPTTVLYKQGIPYSVYAYGQVVTQSILSGISDLGVGGVKTVRRVQLSATLSGAVQARLHYHFDQESTWSHTDWIVLPYDGKFDVQATGVEFALELRSTYYTYLSKLENAVLDFDASGKRNLGRLVFGPR